MAPREQRLRALASAFLHRKTISPLGGLQLDARQCGLLAALCCLPLLEYGVGGMSGWSQLLVYPDAFRVQRSHVDAAGVLPEWEDELIGESWDSGPLVLSWADVQADLDDPRAGYCVAVHEMAHKLDVLDGVLDGTPLLPRAWQRQWADDFQRSYDAFAHAWTAAAPARSMPTPPKRRKSSSPWSANTTSPRRSACSARCPRWPRIWCGSMGRRRLLPAKPRSRLQALRQ